MKVLVIVDAQRDFITDALANPEADKRVKNIVKKLKETDYLNTQVYFTKDTHFDNYMDTFEGQKLPVSHCIKGTDGWFIDDRILDGVEEAVNKYNVEEITRVKAPEFIEKYTFGSLTLMNKLRELAAVNTIEEIEICGFVTSICVVSNALLLRAALPDVKITCDASCCAGLAKGDHDAALTVMRCCQIDVIGE